MSDNVKSFFLGNGQIRPISEIEADLKATVPEAQNFDPIGKFHDMLLSAGFDVQHIEDTGMDKVVRCKVDGSREKVGWYCFHNTGDYCVGAFKDWRSLGESEKFFAANDGSAITEARRQEIDELIKRQREAARLAKIAAQEKAAEKAEQIFNTGRSVDIHPYLTKKEVGAHGLKVDDRNNLMVPLRDASGKLWSIEYIAQNGKKWLLNDGKVQGSYHTIGELSSSKTVWVCEGYSTGATIYDNTGDMVFCARNAGNLPVVVDSIIEMAQEHGVRIVVAADNDHETEAKGKKNAGIEAAEQIKAKHNIEYVCPPKLNEVSDFNDLYIEYGKDAVEQALKVGKYKVEETSSFPILPHLEISRIDLNDDSELEWLIEDIIPDTGTGMIFGASGQYKSFLTIDLALHLSAGLDWHGHETNEEYPILYVVGEGQAGFKERVKAWCKHYGLTEVPPKFVITNQAIDATDKQHIRKLLVMATQELGETPKLVIFDTLNRNFGDGDENSSQDMKKFIDNLDFITREFGSNNLVVHHSGASDPKRARGSTVLKGALDYSLNVYVDNIEDVQDSGAEPEIRFLVEKQKDGEAVMPKTFNRRIVQLGYRRNGKPKTSVVVIPTDYVKNKDWVELAEKGRNAEAGIMQMFVIALRDEFLTNSNIEPIVSAEMFVEMIFGKHGWLIKRDMKPKKEGAEITNAQAKSHFYNAMKRLIKAGIIEQIGQRKGVKYQLKDKGIVTWFARKCADLTNS